MADVGRPGEMPDWGEVLTRLLAAASEAVTGAQYARREDPANVAASIAVARSSLDRATEALRHPRLMAWSVDALDGGDGDGG